jgi:hypothetical protein
MLFVDSLPLQLRNHAHGFVLRAFIEKSESHTFSGLPEFCRAYPRCSLKFHHPILLTTQPVSILFTTLLIKYGARGKISFVQKLTNDPLLQERILELLSRKVLDQPVALMPGNLTFYPYDTFNEGAFRKACDENDLIRDVLSRTLTNGINDLVAIAKESYGHGF